MAKFSYHMKSTILLIGLLMASLGTTSAEIGVCYGLDGNNLPSKPDTVALFKSKNIRRIRLYRADHDALEALRGSNIEVTLGILNPDLQSLATNQAAAKNWVQNNVVNYANDVRFLYIVVGNEVEPSSPFAQYVVPAMQNIQNEINAAGFGNQIKVSTALSMNIIGVPFPPSAGAFKSEYRPLLDAVLGFLDTNQAPLHVNVYPYFAYNDPASHISLDYAIFRATSPVVTDGPYQYYNLFDAMVDTVYAALDKVGHGSRDIIASESGWSTGRRGPHRKGPHQSCSCNVVARIYNQNLINHVKAGRGTPMRPGKPIQAYIFSMFNENLKPDQDIEGYWGLFLPNGQPKYPIHF
ncbi:Glycoside hydrolase, family 17 [Corchorus capsularis]|uniref:glucan endo-1,3-beta-D-glucosidase n=1 Tax=Corchorus capsularis TaxID=210143 RepID=A0A1R3J1P3_COCAP|nr:Glycoside hydrolase, family 17 [Corchorus capsularis]